MLELAAAAIDEIGAGRLAPPRPRRQQLDDLGAAVVGPPLDDAHAHAVAGCRAGDEERDAVDAGEAVAAGDQLLDHHLDLVEAGEAERDLAAVPHDGGASASRRAAQTMPSSVTSGQ